MNRNPSLRWLVAGGVAAAVAVGLGVNALAVADEATTATVCVKPNGQLRVVTPQRRSCVEPESASEWTIDGVKAVSAGAGLVARDDDGLVALEVDPGLLENASSGKIIAGFDDGPRDVPDELGLIAQLPLPAGNYAIFAKLAFRYPPQEGPQTIADVTCRLFAGADFDENHVVVEPFEAASAIFGQGTSAVGQSLEVVHRFEEPGRALLFCSDSSFFFRDGKVVYEDLKIIAVRGSSLSNTFIGA